jgi:hypothetical protein
LAEVGEDSGFAKRDAVLRGCGKEFAEDVVDFGGGEEIAVEGGGNFLAQALGLEELRFLADVESAEMWMAVATRTAASAAIGERERTQGRAVLLRRDRTAVNVAISRHGSLQKERFGIFRGSLAKARRTSLRWQAYQSGVVMSIQFLECTY